MNLSEVFIRRPIATSLIMLGITMFGLVAYRALPVSDLPNVDFPTLNVGGGLPGADPAAMASTVASPLERQFTTIAGLDEMTSSSSNGSANITLQFALNRDSAAVDVQTAIAAALPLLPSGLPAPPSFRKFNPADSPIMFLALTSDTAPMYVLDDYAETLIAPRISMISGVSQVQVQGSQKYAVRVQVDPEKLHAEQLGINEVNQALQNWNVNLSTGQLFGSTTTYNIVDDAIVMLENIVRHMEHGEAAMEAALKGSQEIGFTILSMTISLAAVFIPILFMSGVLGRLFREFAVTITTAVLISGLVSVTLTPMLCSRFLNVAALHAKGRFARVMERIFQRLFHTYEWSLALVLRHRAAMLAVFVVVLLSTARMYVVLPKGFIPDQDNDSLNVNVQAAQGTSYDDMVSYIDASPTSSIATRRSTLSSPRPAVASGR